MENNEEKICPVCHGDSDTCEHCSIVVSNFDPYDFSDKISGDEFVNHPHLNEYRETTNREHPY